jgi:hypothetical protein
LYFCEKITNLPDLLKSASVLKLNSCCFKNSQASSSYDEKVSDAARGNINPLLKAAVNCGTINYHPPELEFLNKMPNPGIGILESRDLR